MAMNKYEKAALELALTRAALTWPPMPNPEPYTVDEVRAHPNPCKTSGPFPRMVVKAWFGNSYSNTVTAGWLAVSSHSHNDPILTGVGGSRDFGRGYKSYADARAALWWDAAMRCAKTLRAIELKTDESEPT